jgi:Rrf2 family transcriptional regulator, cysteine metabolism repressor
MRISPLEEYGLRCLGLLSRAGKGEIISISQMAKAENLSLAYVGKLMFLLQNAGLVEARRGARGGYYLSRSPEEITIQQCLEVFCKRANNLCGRFTGQGKKCVRADEVCPLREIWISLNRQTSDFLNRYTLADVFVNKNQ